MKYLLYTPLFFLFVFLSTETAGFAQQGNVDINRMNRDINIMENVLAEMFKVQLWSPDNTYGTFNLIENRAFPETNQVRGNYLRDYGVIFTVPPVSMPIAITLRGQSRDTSIVYRFTYGNNGTSGAEVTEESVVSRIEEFLRDYGSTIGQLDEDENVIVIYGINNNSPGIGFPLSNRTPPIPAVSVVAAKHDLDAYRAGNLSQSAFRERLSIASVDEPESQPLDMRVMANIFETGLREGGNDGFRLRGSVIHLSLDSFGALFFFDVSYQTEPTTYSSDFAPEELEVLVENARREEESDTGEVEIDVVIERRLEVIRETMARHTQEQTARREERNEAMRTAFDSLKTRLKEFLVDYGRTLNSVSDNQYILASVTPVPSDGILPERTDLQIQKSVLDAMNRGAVTREQALGEITITEY